MQFECAILSSVVCPAVHYVSTLSHKQQDSRKIVIEYNVCLDVLYKFV
jgi:hypothetical protein